MINPSTSGAIRNSFREWIINAPQNKGPRMVDELDLIETEEGRRKTGTTKLADYATYFKESCHPRPKGTLRFSEHLIADGFRVAILPFEFATVGFWTIPTFILEYINILLTINVQDELPLGSGVKTKWNNNQNHFLYCRLIRNDSFGRKGFMIQFVLIIVTNDKPSTPLYKRGGSRTVLLPRRHP